MMQTTRWKKLVAVLALGLGVAAVVPTIDSTPASAQSSEIGPGGEYFPVDPTRVLNTRQAGDPNLDISPAGRKRTDPNGETYRVQIAGRAGVPSDNVLAVAVSVVAVRPTLRGNLAVQPAGTGTSASSSLVNFEANDVTPNFGIVGVSSSGAIEIVVKTNSGVGTTDLIVDVYGWVATSDHNDSGDDGARVRTVVPERLINTRRSGQLPPAMSSPRTVRGRESLQIPVRGRGPVPNSGNVTAVVVNLTGIGPSSQTHLSLTPTRPSSQRSTSNGNYPPGAVRANLAIVPIGADGSIWLTNGDGPLHVVIDVLGYLERGASDATNAGRVVPLAEPFRAFNTKDTEFGAVRLGANQWEDWSFTKFSESVELNGQRNIAQQGFFANLVGFQLQNSDRTHITMNPREPQPFSSAPANSNVNIFANQAAGNMALIRYGTNGQGDDAMVAAYNASGSIHYHLDVYAVVLAD